MRVSLRDVILRELLTVLLHDYYTRFIVIYIITIRIITRHVSHVSALLNKGEKI